MNISGLFLFVADYRSAFSQIMPRKTHKTYTKCQLGIYAQLGWWLLLCLSSTPSNPSRQLLHDLSARSFYPANVLPTDHKFFMCANICPLLRLPRSMHDFHDLCNHKAPRQSLLLASTLQMYSTKRGINPPDLGGLNNERNETPPLTFQFWGERRWGRVGAYPELNELGKQIIMTSRVPSENST